MRANEIRLAVSAVPKRLCECTTPVDDRRMHIATVMIASLLISALVLLLNRGDKIVPVIAIVAAGLEAAMYFGVLTLSVMKFRVDVVLPAVLVVCGGISWARATAKPTITASTVLFAIALMQLLAALRIFN